jgi:hypothetical protein
MCEALMSLSLTYRTGFFHIGSPYGDSVRAITLGSRQNLCVNPKVFPDWTSLFFPQYFRNSVQVNKLPSSQINEACLDLQQNRRDETAAGCPFLDHQLARSLAAATLVCGGFLVLVG